MAIVDLLTELAKARLEKADTEGELTGYNRLLNEVKDYLLKNHSQQVGLSLTDREKKQAVAQIIQDYLTGETGYLLPDLEKIKQYCIQEICGYGPLDDLLANPDINEIMVNNYQEIYIEINGQIQKTSRQFASEEQLINVVRKILAPVGRSLDLANPYVDARLADGSRLNAVLSPIAVHGTCVTIRKFPVRFYTPENLLELGTCSREMLDFLREAVNNRANMLLVGGTSSGKTSTLRSICAYIPSHERLVTIEDVDELKLKQLHPHVVSLEARKSKEFPITLYDLLLNALRMRPDRLIVGEVRGKEALELLEAMNTGHEGSMGTLHANNALQAIQRLVLMILRNSMDLNPELVMRLVCQTLDYIVTMKRLSNGKRVMLAITAVRGYHQGEPWLEDVFYFEEDRFYAASS
ncbi:MAG: CpaF family protein [Bacillota bacterium]